jgi:LysM repeat protein
VTSQTRYGSQGDRPIRKDRVLIVGLVVVAIVVVGILLKSGCTKREDKPVAVLSDGQTVGTTATPPATTGTPPPSDVDSVVKAILPTSSGSTASPVSMSSNASIVSHTVKQGETLQSLATSMGVSVRDLRADNQMYGTAAPTAGRVLYAAKTGLVHTIKSGQTLTDISATYGVSVDAITRANGISSSSTIFAGARLVIPGASSAFWDTVTTLSRGSTAQFIWPLQGAVVSPFGWRQHPVLDMRHHHDGIDLDVPEGTTVYASAGGEVYFTGEQPGYGNVLILEHPAGFYTLYGHLKSSLVNKGQYVEKGQRVAISGNTGISSGPHLHFELRNGEFPVDPISFLP